MSSPSSAVAKREAVGWYCIRSGKGRGCYPIYASDFDVERQQELPAAAKQGRASEQRSSAALSSRRPAKGASLSAAGTASEKPAGAIAREMRPEPPGRRCSICGASPARPFMNAWLCSAHEPVVPIPDPARTTAALRERRSRMVSFVGLLARKAAVDG